MQSSDRDLDFGPGKSLWSLIWENVTPALEYKVRHALGEQLVDKYKMNFDLMERWAQIVEDVQPMEGDCRPPLTDSPVVKELIRGEVHMLLLTLSERAGRDGEELLSHYKPETVSYAQGYAPRCPSSQSEKIDPRLASRISIRSKGKEVFKAFIDKLNSYDMEADADLVRWLFIEESKALKEEIRQLQNLAVEKRLQPAEPTLGDLKELRDAIQRDLTHCPVPSESSLKKLNSTHRAASLPALHLRVPSATSITSDHQHFNNFPFPAPRPPSDPRPASSRKGRAICVRRETSSSELKEHVSPSPSRPSSALINRDEDQPSPGRQSTPCPVPTDTISFPTKLSKISATQKTHGSLNSTSNKGVTQSNLSPLLKRRHSFSHGSSNTIRACSNVCLVSCHVFNKDTQRNDCPGMRKKTPNGQKITTSGSSILPNISPSSLVKVQRERPQRTELTIETRLPSLSLHPKTSEKSSLSGF